MGRGKATRAAANHREALWQARRDVVTTNVVLFALTAMVAVLCIGGVALLYAIVVGSELLAGFALGSLGVGLAAAALWTIDAHAGAHNERFGTYGEEATAHLFESRRMRRDGWKIVHNLAFAGLGDVDHVAVGASGVLVIESKWANCPWTLQDGTVNAFGKDPLDQVRREADKIKRLLASEGVEITPQPVLVQWGPGGLDRDDWSDHLIDGVLVVRRPRSTRWLDLLPCASGPEADGTGRQAALDVLIRFRDRALAARDEQQGSLSGSSAVSRSSRA